MHTLRFGLRTAAVFAAVVPVTIVYAAAVIFISLVRPSSPALNSITRSWGRLWCRAAGVELTVEGLERIDLGQAYVVVSNHRSAFDVFAHFAVLPIPIRFLAKKELFKIPLFGPAMRRIGIVEVDRSGGRATHQSINSGARRNMEQGRSLMIYPEGTRPRDGVMLPFKKGAFNIARTLGAPVLPTAVTGSREVWKPDTKLIHPGKIAVKIMEPIPTEGMKIYELEGLRNRVYSLVREAAGAGAPAGSDHEHGGAVDALGDGVA